jgi:hypothetical protein
MTKTERAELGKRIGPVLALAMHELKTIKKCIESEDGCAGDWSDHLDGINAAIEKIREAKL